MINLVLKDLKVQMHMCLICIAVILVMTAVFVVGINSGEINISESYAEISMIYIFVIIIFPINSINYIIAKTTGRRNSSNVLLRSLPINMKDIVMSKVLTPIVVFLLYNIIAIIPMVFIYVFCGINVLNFEVVLIAFIVFYGFSVFNMYMNLLYPESNTLAYVRVIPVFILALSVTLLKKIVLTVSELTLILENLNVVLMFIAVVIVVIAFLSVNIVLKKYKAIEI